MSDNKPPEGANSGVTELKPRKAAAASGRAAAGENSQGPANPGEAGPSSTKPYLIRAIHEWCTDNGFTPYLSVVVDGRCQVPQEFVKNGEIVLNVGYLATNKLKIANDWIEFAARFGGKAREIMVPIDQVAAIYARENGHGMGFEIPQLRSEHRPPSKPALSAIGSAAADGGGVETDRADSAQAANGEAGALVETAPPTDASKRSVTDDDAPAKTTVGDTPSTAGKPAHEAAPPLPSNVSELKKPGRAKLTVVK